MYNPYVLESDVCVFFDIDNTLIKWSPNHDTWAPHKRHITELKKFYKRGQPIVIWSSGGYKHALNIIKKLELEKYVTIIMAKPRWWADDCLADDVLPSYNRIFYQDNQE